MKYSFGITYSTYILEKDKILDPLQNMQESITFTIFRTFYKKPVSVLVKLEGKFKKRKQNSRQFSS